MRLAVYVDVQNIYYTTKQAYGRQFDYHAFWKHISQQGDIKIANAYAIDRGDNKQRKFQDALRHIGFNVKLKPFISRSDGSAKGDWDVGITIDVLEGSEKADIVILLSGDGDFDLLLNKILRSHNVQTEVYGVEQLTANSLIKAATIFHPIGERFLL
jgi:uncharacterized LabA/DUF88 family protein